MLKGNAGKLRFLSIFTYKYWNINLIFQYKNIKFK